MLPGTPGLTLADVTHVLIPGYGRDADATALTSGGVDRCRTALALHRSLNRGLIVCSGYKSPADHTGAPQSIDGCSYQGVPEADLMRAWLVETGADPASIRVERRSVDTVTNLLRSDLWFGDERPVAIVSHRSHLRRILSVIAPRTLRRPYLGVVVPGGPPRENPALLPMSRLITAFLPGGAAAVPEATRRADRLWRAAGLLGRRS
ncbi:DUF218 domain-containing protein [Actinoplanes derwentensis]|uniref:DUF218 domain-containing protein n=1 Tax=Actinoplanes derwentensis TaxID=113562 RepID=A0A1H2C3P0_9ACTN|nr:DUF218 domain-containing protein [Actinoplanes derwentensis]